MERVDEATHIARYLMTNTTPAQLRSVYVYRVQKDPRGLSNMEVARALLEYASVQTLLDDAEEWGDLDCSAMLNYFAR